MFQAVAQVKMSTVSIEKSMEKSDGGFSSRHKRGLYGL